MLLTGIYKKVLFYVIYTINQLSMHNCDANQCPVRATLKVIGGKWKLPILWYLREETLRYGELQKLIEGITPKMLAEQLRELERDGIVDRTVYPVVPPKVEYSLTDYGRTLDPILRTMGEWGDRHLNRIETDTSKNLHASLVLQPVGA